MKSPFAVFTDGTDTYIALDRSDLEIVYFEQTGSTMAQEMITANDFDELPDDKEITITVEEAVDIEKYGWTHYGNDGQRKCTKLAHEWATLSGRGLLCSTEF